MRQTVYHTRCPQPRFHLVPANMIVVEHACYLMEWEVKAPENIRNLRHRAGAAMGEPLSGHRPATTHLVEALILNRRFRLKVQKHHRNPCSQHHGEQRRRQSISGHVNQQDVDIVASAGVARLQCLLWSIDKTEIEDASVSRFNLSFHLGKIPQQSSFQTIKLRPIRFQRETRQPDTQLLITTVHSACLLACSLSSDRVLPLITNPSRIMANGSPDSIPGASSNSGATSCCHWQLTSL